MSYSTKTQLSNGTIKIVWFDNNDKIHRENDLPAVYVINMTDGTVQSEVWYKHGRRHRENNPAIKNSIANIWFVNGKFKKYELSEVS